MQFCVILLLKVVFVLELWIWSFRLIQRFGPVYRKLLYIISVFTMGHLGWVLCLVLCSCSSPWYLYTLNSDIGSKTLTNLLCFIGTQLSTGAAIETYWRGHRKWSVRPSKPTGAAIENDRRGHRNRCVYRPSKMTGAAIETYRRGHRNLLARPSKMTSAAIKTYRRGHRNLPAGHFRWPRRSFSMAAPVAAIATPLCPYEAQYKLI